MSNPVKRTSAPEIVAAFRARWAALSVGLAALYFVSGRACLLLASYERPVTLLWPPTGLSLAAVLIFGRKLWPGVWIGALAVNLTSGLPISVCALIATGNTMAAVGGSILLERSTTFRPSFASLRDVLVYLAYGALLSTTISATVGSTSLCLGDAEWTEWSKLWLTWWLGDAGGVLTVGAAILVWTERPTEPGRIAGRAETALLGVIVFTSSLLIFGGGLDFAGPSLVFLPLPVLMWVALRCGPRCAASSSLVTVIIAAVGTARGHGPFAVENFHHSMAFLWLFMVVATLTSMILAAVLLERRHAEAELRRNQARLQLLTSIATGMTTGTPISEILERTVAGVAAFFPDFRIAYSTFDARGVLDVLVSREPPGMPSLQGLQADLSKAPAYLKALREPGSLAVRDIREDSRFASLTEEMQAGCTRAVLDVPIRHSDQLVGLLCFDAPTPQDWTVHQTRTLVDAGQLLALMLKDAESERERNDLQSQVLHAQKLESLGVLAGGIAHDFNNLLTSILGHADLALLKMSDGASAEPSLNGIRAAATRASELCRQMLAYSGKSSLSVEAIDLNELIRDTAQLLDVSVSKKAEIRNCFAEKIPAVLADASQVQQIVMNLIINASEAGGDGCVKIELATGKLECNREYLDQLYFEDHLPEGQYVYFEVSDDGCGMDEETQARVFDPFFTTKFAGRGLGLAAALGIVRSHRGGIQVISRPGAGTRITVLFPAVETSVKPKSAEPRASDDWRGEGTILLVDDEPDVLAVGQRFLTHYGFRVVTAGDGVEALDRFHELTHEVSCVLLDLTMPRMDGLETLHELRRIRSDVPVILCSGFSEQEIADKLADEQIAAFLSKPYLFSEVLDKLRQVLEQTASIK